MKVFCLILFAISIARAEAADESAHYTFEHGMLKGAETQVGDLLAKKSLVKGKRVLDSWGKVSAISENGAQTSFEVTLPDGTKATYALKEVVPEKKGDLELGAGAEKKTLTRGQQVFYNEEQLFIETFFYPDWVLLKNFATRQMPLVRAADVKPIPPAEIPVLPKFRAEIFTQEVATKFQLQPAGASEASLLSFRPAESNYLGFSFGYDGIGASYAFGIPASKKIRDTEGTSQYTDLRLNYYTRRFGVELAYSKYTSYILENSAALTSATLGTETFFKLPLLNTTGYGASFVYVFSPLVYSLPAGNDHTEVQAESAGSFLGFVSYRRQNVHNEGFIIPLERRSQFGEVGGITGFRTFSYAAGPGYGYNWIPKYKLLGDYFFVAPLLGLSLGYERFSEDLFARTLEAGAFGLNVHVRLSFGWNSPGFFLVSEVLSDSFTGKTEGVQLGASDRSGKLAIGVRF